MSESSEVVTKTPIESLEEFERQVEPIVQALAAAIVGGYDGLTKGPGSEFFQEMVDCAGKYLLGKEISGDDVHLALRSAFKAVVDEINVFTREEKGAQYFTVPLETFFSSVDAGVMKKAIDLSRKAEGITSTRQAVRDGVGGQAVAVGAE